jgi:hypothetical protein
MQINRAKLSWLKWLLAVLFPAVLFVLILDPGGWGKLLLDLGYSFLAQAVITGLFYGWLMVIIQLILHFTHSDPLPAAFIKGLFFISVFLGLLLITSVFHRGIDIFDILFALLIAAAGLGSLRYFGGWQRIRAVLGRFLSAAPEKVERPRVSAPIEGLTPNTNSPAYHALLLKVGGHRDTAQRLIEYEYLRNPGGDIENLIQSAIFRLDHDPK